MQGSLIEITG